ncbi:MAG: ATP-binding protein [Pseudomonadales bacterium]
MGDAGALLLIRDVTQLNRLLSMRQDFVANVSHELRTPLTVILGYLETLQEDDLDAETRRMLIDKVVPPAQRMHALLQDLLILTRLESESDGGIEGRMPIDMEKLLGRVVAQVGGLAGAAHRLVIDARSAHRLIGVPSEIESAVGNLLSNAIRYSPDGGEIRIGWRDAPEGAVLDVRDQGIGIPREHLSRLTERFYRVDLARARAQGGTGLGLAIVKHVLKRHGAVLQVESEPGRGSRFFTVFPPARLAPFDKTLEVVG